MITPRKFNVLFNIYKGQQILEFQVVSHLYTFLLMLLTYHDTESCISFVIFTRNTSGRLFSCYIDNLLRLEPEPEFSTQPHTLNFLPKETISTCMHPRNYVLLWTLNLFFKCNSNSSFIVFLIRHLYISPT